MYSRSASIHGGTATVNRGSAVRADRAGDLGCCGVGEGEGRARDGGAVGREGERKGEHAPAQRACQRQRRHRSVSSLRIRGC
eukprot:3783503-Rhodomonas_salina.1